MNQLETEKIEPQNRVPVSEYQAFQFKGTGKEYFRIWIINIALTILTLGIYSAWAKVRTNRYFYANTYLNGSNFEYNANPKRILIGRIVVVTFYGLFVLFSQQLMLFKVAGGILLLAFLLMPWLVRQAVSFKLRNTSYRNVPFKYRGDISKFYDFFLTHSLLNIFTLFLIFPYSYVTFKKLIINDSYYGQTKFNFRGKTGSVYGIYFQLFLWNLLFVALFSFFATLLGTAGNAFLAYLGMDIHELKEMISPEILTILLSALFIIIYLIAISWQKAFADAYFANFIRDHTALNNAPFRGNFKPFTLAFIGVSNILLTILSLGLFYPWAKIRYLKYKIEHSWFACQNYEQFESDGYETGSTVGEEMVDFFDIDIGL